MLLRENNAMGVSYNCENSGDKKTKEKRENRGKQEM
jgi:hypothetical protein